MVCTNYVILAYKGKLLLFSHDIEIDDVTQNVWSFVGSRQLAKEKSENAIARIAKHTTNLDLKNITLMSSITNDKLTDNYYCAKLTDDQVNQIDRRSRQRLEFFKLSEINKLNLAAPTREFLAEYRKDIKELLDS